MPKVCSTPCLVEFYIFSEDEDEFILDKKEIEAEYEDSLKARRDAEKKAKTSKDNTERAIAKNQVEILDALLERQVYLLTTVIPASGVQKYELFRPTYGTTTEYKSRPDVTKETPEGAVYTNEKRLVNLLLPLALKGPDENKPRMTDDEIANLHPDIGERLEAKLHGLLYPSLSRLRFRPDRDQGRNGGETTKPGTPGD